MPIAAHSEDTGGYDQPVSLAGALQIIAPALPTPPPLQIADGATWSSGVTYSMGFKALTVGIKADHAGTLKIYRYLDLAGTIQQALSSTAIVANVALVVNVYDNLPYVSYQLQVVNGAGAVSNIVATDFGVLMNST